MDGKQNVNRFFHCNLEDTIRRFHLTLETFHSLNTLNKKTLEEVRKDITDWEKKNSNELASIRNRDDIFEIMEKLTPAHALLKEVKSLFISIYNSLSKIISKSPTIEDERYGDYPVDVDYQFGGENKDLEGLSINMLSRSSEETNLFTAKKQMDAFFLAQKELDLRELYNSLCLGQGPIPENVTDMLGLLVEVLKKVIRGNRNNPFILEEIATIIVDYKCFMKNINLHQYTTIADELFSDEPEDNSNRMQALWYFTKACTSMCKDITLDDGVKIWDYFRAHLAVLSFGYPDRVKEEYFDCAETWIKDPTPPLSQLSLEGGVKEEHLNSSTTSLNTYSSYGCSCGECTDYYQSHKGEANTEQLEKCCTKDCPGHPKRG